MAEHIAPQKYTAEHPKKTSFLEFYWLYELPLVCAIVCIWIFLDTRDCKEFLTGLNQCKFNTDASHLTYIRK